MLACALDLEDLDRDGFAADEDCDDTLPEVFPGADEIAGDGVDQDCDGSDATLAVSGEVHSCWLSQGTIHCQGTNELGQLEAPPGESWTALAAGAYHTCALGEHEVRCWGDNRYGQSDPPPIDGATWIAAAEWASLAEVDGSIVCWGLCRIDR